MRDFNNSNNGVAAIAAVLTLLTMGMFGASVVSVVAEEQELRMTEWEETQAFYVAMTGLEYGLRETNDGGYPNVTNKSFAGGTFTTQLFPDTHVLTVASTVGVAQRAFQIQVDQLAGDCAELDSTGAVPIGSTKDEINRVKIRKNCLSKVRINTFQASWVPDTGQELLRIDYDGDTIYDNPSGVPSGTMVDVTDVVITDGSEHQFSRIIFTSNISGITMTITVVFSDGTATSTTWYVN